MKLTKDTLIEGVIVKTGTEVKIRESSKDITNIVIEYLVSNKDRLEKNHLTVAVRYDNHKYKVGELIPNSKTNIGRDDERDFPLYGTSDYENMDEIDGTSAYMLTSQGDYRYEMYDRETLEDFFEDEVVEVGGDVFDHCNLVEGVENTSEYIEDKGEIILKACKVVKNFS
ncbi:MAG: hypothetical protein PF569_06470 [Candidatus Woesearchaeota archaeon]|jgi:hypothetical protein|nr:hypothetical protein [Candidatus Woesearchaeota archaeon]